MQLTIKFLAITSTLLEKRYLKRSKNRRTLAKRWRSKKLIKKTSGKGGAACRSPRIPTQDAEGDRQDHKKKAEAMFGIGTR
jgi:hypothetical protein